MVERWIYNELKETFGKVSSWTVWRDQGTTPKSNISDLSVFNEPGITDRLTTKYVFLGLNPSKHDDANPKDEDWAAFHSDDTKRQNDFKLRYALRDTPFWGAYITDLIKHISDEKSGNVMACYNNDPQIRETVIRDLSQELDIIGDRPGLIAIGDNAFRILKDILPDLPRKDGIMPIKDIVKIPHFSNQISKEEYRNKVIRILNGFDKSCSRSWAKDNTNVCHDYITKVTCRVKIDGTWFHNSPEFGGSIILDLDRFESRVSYEEKDSKGKVTLRVSAVIDPEELAFLFCNLDEINPKQCDAGYGPDANSYEIDINHLSGASEVIKGSGSFPKFDFVEEWLNRFFNGKNLPPKRIIG